MENIHFKLSEIWKEGMGNKKINTIIVASYEEFKIIKDKTVLPERISTEKPVLLENTSQDLFILDYVKSGIGYYVSEMVKNEMEEAGCTGIRFEEINTSNT